MRTAVLDRDALAQLRVTRGKDPELQQQQRPGTILAHDRTPLLGGLPDEILIRVGFYTGRVLDEDPTINPSLEDREEQIRLGGEVRVDGTLRETSLSGDPVKRRTMEAVAQEDRGTRI
jgi:hypothetical protein